MRRPVLYVVIAAAVIAAGILSAPLFYDVEVDEPLPVLTREGITLEEFSEMDDAERQVVVGMMSENEKGMIMEMAADTSSEVSEGMDGAMDGIVSSGTFEGLFGHSATGTAQVIRVGDQSYLRFEDFAVTNGPDLKVYLTPTGDVGDGKLLADLKGSRGSQNYLLSGEDLEIAGYVVIYCQPFHVYFASAQLAG